MREILILVLLACECPSAVAVCRENAGMKRKAVFDLIFPSLHQWLQREHRREDAHLQACVGASHVVREGLGSGRGSSFCQ